MDENRENQTEKNAVGPEGEQPQPEATLPEAPGPGPMPGGPEMLPLVDCAIAGKRFSAVGLSCIVLLAAATAAQVILMLPVYFSAALADSALYQLIAAYLPMFIAGYPVCMTVLRLAPRGTLTRQKMSGKGFFLCVLMSIALMYVGNYIGIGVMALFRLAFGVSGGNPLDLVMETGLWVRFLLMVVAAPLAEEYIFRKQMIDRLHRYGEGVSILASGLLFGLIHGNLSQFFYAFLLGSLFAYIYTRTGVIWYTIALHAIVNFLGGILGPLAAEAAYTGTGAITAAELPGMVLSSLFSIAILAAMVAGIVLLIRQRKQFILRPTEAEIPRGRRLRTAFGNVGMILAVVLLGIITLGQSLFLLLV